MSDRANKTRSVAAVLIASLPIAACVTPQHDEMLCWQQYGQYFCTPLAAMTEYPAWVPSDDATVVQRAPRGATIVTEQPADDSRTVVAGFDNNGRPNLLETSENGDAELAGFDNNGRPTLLDADGGGDTELAGFDNNGRPNVLDSDDSGDTELAGFDDNGRPNALSDGQISGFDENGKPSLLSQ